MKPPKRLEKIEKNTAATAAKRIELKKVPSLLLAQMELSQKNQLNEKKKQVFKVIYK